MSLGHLSWCLLLAAGPALAADTAKPIANLRLLDVAGQPQQLHDLRDRAAIVVVFLSFECPVSNSYVPVLNELAKTYANRKVTFLAVAPTDESAVELARQAKEFQLAFPLYRDAELVSAKAFATRNVPEAFLLDGKFTLRYRGRIDDSYARRLEKKRVFDKHDLRDALDALLAGKDIKEPVTEPVGCKIFYPRARAGDGKVTYHRDVVPILQAHCQQCHRPGEVGPFSLLTYQHAVTWADDLVGYTKSKKMPPWKPVGGQPMKSERRMTAKEIDTLAAWVAAGTPEGDAKDAPPVKKFTDGWTLGPPDLILEPNEEMTVGASGGDLFRCFVLPTTFKEDRYVVAYEVRPGNPRVVHHTLHFLDTRGRARRLEESAQQKEDKKGRDFGPGYSSRMGPGFFPPSGDVGGWAPGLRPHYMPDGVGYYLPKGSDIVLQVHYHRTGRVEKDRTRLGLYLAKGKTERALQGIPVPGLFLTIPPGSANYKVRGDLWLAQDAQLHNCTPHMHLLGKAIKITMTPPGGTTTTLVDIAEWDYNWQETYFFKEPIKAPAGTKLSVEAVYDNSARNRNNPNSPPQFVFPGEQTTNEMCFGFVGVTTEDGKAAGFRLSENGFILRRLGALPTRPTP